MKSYSILSRLLALSLIVMSTVTLYGQGEIPAVWNVAADSASWIGSTSNAERGMAFNPVTNHVLVAARSINKIVILDAANGASVGALDMTGISGGTYTFNKVAVSSDGVIYTTNLTLASTTTATPLKIYAWANEAAAPKLVFNDTIAGPRLGDGLAVVGSGTDIYVYVAGNASPGPINVFQGSADTLMVRKTIVVAGWSAGIIGFGPTTNGLGDVWINTSGKPAVKVDTNGTPLDTIPGGIVSSGAVTAHYFELYGHKYLAMFSGNSNPKVVRVVDVTNGGANASVVAITPTMGSIANSNATGEAVYSAADSTLYALGTNNSVGKYDIKGVPPTVSYAYRVPFVPMNNENDSVYFSLKAMKPVQAKVKYYGYRTVNSDNGGVDSAEVTGVISSGDNSLGVFYGEVPGSVNRDGRRIMYKVIMTDGDNNVYESAMMNGYYAGISKLTLQGGPREVDTNGVLLYPGYGIRVHAEVIAEDSIYQVSNNEIVVEDDFGGATVFKTGSSGPLFDVMRGNLYEVSGTISPYNGKLQFVEPGLSFVDMGAATPKPPRAISIRDLNTNGELYENRLVVIHEVYKAATSAAWPAAGSSANMLFVDNSGDSVTMRIDSDTDIDGTPEPEYPITIFGVAGQFDSSNPYTSGYQWLPRDNRDIIRMGTSTRTIDDFSQGVGHFGTNPTYSGSTVGIDASSTSTRITDRSHSGPPGAMEIRLVDAASAGDWGVRLLSGVGATGANDSLGAVGHIGYWLRTSNAPMGATVAIGLDDPSDPATKRSVKLPVINDGEWHLYQWDIADSNQWTAWVVTSGSPKIKGPRVTIDAVWFFAPDGSAPWVIHLDDVKYNPNGVIGVEPGRGDITRNGNISALDASWLLQYVVAQRTFTPGQVLNADVNLSDMGKSADALDASVILAHVVGKIPFLPWKNPLPPLSNINQDDPAPVSLSISEVKGTVGQKVTIPISVPYDLVGVRSAQMRLTFNNAELKVLSVKTSDVTKDFALAANIQDGAVAIAMANGEALANGGQLIIVEAEILKASDGISITAENVILNDRKVASATSVGHVDENIPTTYNLMQNYPNPFNPSTTIEYQLPHAGFVELRVYDVAGREVATLVSELQNPGTYRVQWNASDVYGNKVASGVYFYRITAGSFSQIKKMMLLK